MEQQLATNTTTVEQEEEEEEDDQFDMAYRTVFTNELENRARRVKQVAFVEVFQLVNSTIHLWKIDPYHCPIPLAALSHTSVTSCPGV